MPALKIFLSWGTWGGALDSWSWSQDQVRISWSWDWAPQGSLHSVFSLRYTSFKKTIRMSIRAGASLPHLLVAFRGYVRASRLEWSHILDFSGEWWFQKFCLLVPLRTLVYSTQQFPKFGSGIMATVPTVPRWQLGGWGGRGWWQGAKASQKGERKKEPEDNPRTNPQIIMLF